MEGTLKGTFEMPAIQEDHGCIGFLPRLNVGNELIVYAHHLAPSDPEYFPIVCNSLLVKDVKDLAKTWVWPKTKQRVDRNHEPG